MSLSPDDVRKVARLARLELAEADPAHLQSQLSAILDYVAQLQQRPGEAQFVARGGRDRPTTPP